MSSEVETSLSLGLGQIARDRKPGLANSVGCVAVSAALRMTVKDAFHTTRKHFLAVFASPPFILSPSTFLNFVLPFPSHFLNSSFLMKLLLAAILAGIAMFIWTTLAHTVLPLGQIGVREMRGESAIIEALSTNLGKGDGLYLYPGLGVGHHPTPEAKQEAMKHMGEKLANGPSGFLVYHPRRPLNFPRLLGVEFVTELVEAFLAVFLLAQTRLVTYGARVGFVTVAGILAAIATNISYWNWYGFPKRYTASYMFIEIVGFFIVGLVSALVLKPSTRPVS
jgi:hypothetical protein